MGSCRPELGKSYPRGSQFEALYLEISKDLLIFIRFLIRKHGVSIVSVKDVLQETSFTAWKYHCRFKVNWHSRDRFLVWMKRIARNLIRNLKRKQSRLIKLSVRLRVGVDDADPRALFEKMEVSDLLSTSLETLPKAPRQAIVQVFYRGKSLQELASKLGISSNAAKKRLQRYLSIFRHELQKRFRNFEEFGDYALF